MCVHNLNTVRLVVSLCTDLVKLPTTLGEHRGYESPNQNAEEQKTGIKTFNVYIQLLQINKKDYYCQ